MAKGYPHGKNYPRRKTIGISCYKQGVGCRQESVTSRVQKGADPELQKLGAQI